MNIKLENGGLDPQLKRLELHEQVHIWLTFWKNFENGTITTEYSK